MEFKDLASIYEKYRRKYGDDTHKYVSRILTDAKKRHRKDFLKLHRNVDHEQSWRAFKGKNMEKLILHMIVKEVRGMGLEIIGGGSFERTKPGNLGGGMDKVARNVLVNFGEYGWHLPDVDMVIYDPKTFKVLAVISSKVTLRERVSQTGYWKLKLASGPGTEHIKVFFVTPDEDGTLKNGGKMSKKGRAIVETDTDGCYVLTEERFEKSKKVKGFEQFVDDLESLLRKR